MLRCVNVARPAPASLSVPLPLQLRSLSVPDATLAVLDKASKHNANKGTTWSGRRAQYHSSGVDRLLGVKL